MVRPWVYASVLFVLFLAPQVRAQEKYLVAEKTGQVKVFHVDGPPRQDPTHAFVITHGMGGIQDRFWELGCTIAAKEPRANVFIVDWTPGATKGSELFMNPWAVAATIDPTGDALTELFVDLHKAGQFDPSRATFVGESFGNYVNNRVAFHFRMNRIGTVAYALVFNPATGLGGYAPPDLKVNYVTSVAFITESMFDTQMKIAHHTLRLETPTSNAYAQHTYGVLWLRQRVNEDDSSWLFLCNDLPTGAGGDFDGVIRMRGTLYERAQFRCTNPTRERGSTSLTLRVGAESRTLI